MGILGFFCRYDGLISRFIFEIAREFAWVRSSRVIIRILAKDY